MLLLAKELDDSAKSSTGKAEDVLNPAERTPAPLELTILMPCLNEAQTLADCIVQAQGFIDKSGIRGEVLIADNGSSDGSQAIARAHRARLIEVGERGYGSALIAGISAARGRYVIIGDADSSYNFAELTAFISRLRAGYQLVMGNRFQGGILPGAMPKLHRYLGNPVLSQLGRLFYGSPVGDFHCGLRGFERQAIMALRLRSSGMEFASEMVVKATLHGLRIAEVPTTLAPDGRSRVPHLRSWRDGWRHLRLLLIYSPRWLFFYPGLLLCTVGVLLTLWLLPGPRSVGGITFDIHTLLYAAMAIPLGLQAVGLALFAKSLAISYGLLPDTERHSQLLTKLSLERGLFAGLVLILLGIIGTLIALRQWQLSAFGPLTPEAMMRLVIPALAALISGAQLMLMSFFWGMLRLKPA